MKTIILAAFAVVSPALAGTPVVIVQPAPQSTVVSRLTTTTAQSNQQLLNQITGSLRTQRFEHQLSTTQAAIRAQTPVIQPAPRIVIQKK